jgi:hypothetical protein
MTDVRGIHYEISKPKLNPDDGHYYQRVRQVDDQGTGVLTAGARSRRSLLPMAFYDNLAPPLLF